MPCSWSCMPGSPFGRRSSWFFTFSRGVMLSARLGTCSKPGGRSAQAGQMAKEQHSSCGCPLAISSSAMHAATRPREVGHQRLALHSAGPCPLPSHLQQGVLDAHQGLQGLQRRAAGAASLQGGHGGCQLGHLEQITSDVQQRRHAALQSRDLQRGHGKHAGGRAQRDTNVVIALAQQLLLWASQC